MWLQSKLIRYILEPIAGVMDRVSQRTKDNLFVAAGTLMALMQVVYCFCLSVELHQMRYLYNFAFVCLMLAVMGLCTLKKGLKPVRFDWVVFICGGCIGISALIATVTVHSAHIADGVLALILLPMLYLIWSGCDFSRITVLLLRVNRMAFLVMLAILLVFYPVTNARYEGVFYNANGIAFYMTLVSCCLLLEIHGTKKLSLQLFDMVLLGVSVAYVVYSNSRTGQYGLILVAAIFAGMLLLTDRKGFVRFCIRKLPGIVLCIALLIPTLIPISQIPMRLFNGAVPQGETIRTYIWAYNHDIPISLVIAEQQAAQAPAPAPEANPDAQAPAAPNTLQQIMDTNEEKADMGDKSLSYYSTGRLDIWEAWLKEVTLGGHTPDDIVPVELVFDVKVATAHNMIIQVAYDLGALAGIAYLVFNIYCGCRSVAYALRKKGDPYALAPLIITIAFGFVSVLATLDAFTYAISTFYYLVQAPLALRWMKKEKELQNAGE